MFGGFIYSAIGDNTPHYNKDLDFGAPNFFTLEYYKEIIGTMNMEWLFSSNSLELMSL